MRKQAGGDGPHAYETYLMFNACYVGWRCCRYDGTVRNSAGDVVQFLYGEDGMDGVRIERQHFEHLKFDDAKLR